MRRQLDEERAEQQAAAQGTVTADAPPALFGDNVSRIFLVQTGTLAYANGQVIAQAVAAVGSLDQHKLGDYIKTHSFDTIVGKVAYASNGEWKDPRVLWVQYQNISGNSLDQFKKAGTQVIVYPKELASGKLQFPYSEGH